MEYRNPTREKRRRMFADDLKEMAADPQIQAELRQIEWESSGGRLSVPCGISTAVTIDNLFDLWDSQRGRISASAVRRATISESLLDTSIPFLCVPANMVRDLGLLRTGETKWIGSTIACEAAMFQPVRVTILGQICTMDVLEIPDEIPLIIGNLVVTHLDLYFDAHGSRLVESRAHVGE